ncbi:30S ribosomal protein S2 [Calditrichota bacterium]
MENTIEKTGKTSRVTVDQLLLAGAHFGHLTERWNPKMRRYIFTARNGIYLIDLVKTQSLVEQACKRIAQITAQGEDVLFVGTKKQARDIVENEASRAGSPYVSYRWLGGMLTNFSTIRRSVKTLENYEKMETDGTAEKLTKKEQLMNEKAKIKLLKTLGGIRDMRRLPGAIYIIDTLKEDIAVAEARKLGIPVFAIVDTNVDPDVVDFPIPANDDAFKSIGLISRVFTDAIIEGKQRASQNQQLTAADEAEHAVQGRGEDRPKRQRRRKPRTRKPAENTSDSQQVTADSEE